MNWKLPFLALLLCPAPFLPGQGSLNPPGAPAPTMHSLQELWGRQQELTTEVRELRKENAALNTALGALLTQAGLEVPWKISVVDASGNAGQHCTLDFDPSGRPAIAYQDGGNEFLRFAFLKEGTWLIETPDPNTNRGTFISMAIDQSGTAYIAYRNNANGHLLWAHNRSGWTFFLLDSNVSATPYNNVAINPVSGLASLAYKDSDRLSYLVPDAPNSLETISLTSTAGDFVDLTFRKNGEAFVAYHNTSGSDLHLQRRENNAWTFPLPAETSGNTGFEPSATLGPLDTIWVAYRFSTGEIKYVQTINGGGFFTSENVTSGHAQGNVDIAFTPFGRPIVAYSSLLSQLSLAYFDGSAWKHQVVDPDSTVISHFSLEISPQGRPALAYYDEATKSLKYAVQSLPD